MNRRAAWMLGLALAALGCGPDGAQFVASPADWASYRQTRVAPSLEQRIAASALYLRRHPDGAFAPRVRAWLDRADRVYFQAKRGSAAGVRAYLRVLPRGNHRAEATRLLAKYTARAAQGEDLGRMAGATEARLAELAAERGAARDAVADWVRRFLRVEVWQRPLADAPEELRSPWSSPPAPSCSEGEGERLCEKALELPYSLPGRVGPDRRQIDLEIVVALGSDGRMREVALRGPNLFGRLEETHSARAADRTDARARERAVARAVDAVGAIFRTQVSSNPACQKPASAPVALELGCEGMRVQLRAGDGAFEDDAIVIARAQP